MNESEIKRSLQDLVDAAGNMKDEDLALVFVAPEHFTPQQALPIVEQVTERAGVCRIALYFGVDGRPAGWESTWGVEVTERWAREFVDNCSPGLAGLIDEPVLRHEKGKAIDLFPGIGLVRLLVLAGYGARTESKTPCGNTVMDVRLDEEGDMIARAVRQARNKTMVS